MSRRWSDTNGEALAGVTTVAAYVGIRNWQGVETDRDRFQNNAQEVFELGLRRDGVIVNEGAPNYLFCNIWAAQTGGTVTFAFQVMYFTCQTIGVHILEWSDGGIVTVGSDNFTPEGMVGSCVDYFANEWLKWNPGR